MTVIDLVPAAKTRCAHFANGAVKRSSTSRRRLTSGRVTFPTSKVVGEKERMSFQPQRASGDGWVDTNLIPPSQFVAAAMDFPVMAATERYGELITCSTIFPPAIAGRGGEMDNGFDIVLLDQPRSGCGRSPRRCVPDQVMDHLAADIAGAASDKDRAAMHPVGTP